MMIINADDYAIFRNNITTLKETSKDTSQEHVAGVGNLFMTDSSLLAVNFDKVKEDYVKGLGLPEVPKSVDAVYMEPDNGVYFIEFKNGLVNDSKAYSIRKKIYDSMLIFNDIINKGISFTRDNINCILVYNAGVNTRDTTDAKSQVQDSESRDDIAKHWMGKGCENYIKFGLEIFRNYCFKEVYTYTEKEFEDFLSRLS